VPHHIILKVKHWIRYQVNNKHADTQVLAKTWKMAFIVTFEIGSFPHGSR
jgi:hypothetical protein